MAGFRRLDGLLRNIARLTSDGQLQRSLVEAARNDRAFSSVYAYSVDTDVLTEVCAKLARMNPTAQSKYTTWLISEYIREFEMGMEDRFGLDEDVRVSRVLGVFVRAQRHLARLGLPSDIFAYSFREVEEVANRLSKEVDRLDTAFVRVPIPDAMKDQAEVLHAGPDGTLYRVYGWEAARHLGRGTRWDIAASYENMGPYTLLERLENGPVFVWIAPRRKIVLYPGDAEVRNTRGQLPAPREMRAIFAHPTLRRWVFDPEERRILETDDMGAALVWAEAMVRGRWRGAEDLILATPVSARRYVERVVGERWSKAEEVIRKSPWEAVKYARGIVGGRWPEAEDVIRAHPRSACEYALLVLRGRWPEAEETIRTNAHAAVRYAQLVVGGRWPEAEPTILGDAEAAYLYARNVIRGRWPEAEERILSLPEMALAYLRQIVRGPWPEAEPVFVRDPRLAYEYAVLALRSRWPEAEPTILADEFWGPLYRSTVIEKKLVTATTGLDE